MAVSNAIEVDKSALIGEVQERIAAAHALICAVVRRDAIEACFIYGVYWILKDVPEQLYEVMGEAQLRREETAGLNGLLAYLRRIALDGDDPSVGAAAECRLIADVLARANKFVCHGSFTDACAERADRAREARARRIAEGLNA